MQVQKSYNIFIPINDTRFCLSRYYFAKYAIFIHKEILGLLRGNYQIYFEILWTTAVVRDELFMFALNLGPKTSETSKISTPKIFPFLSSSTTTDSDISRLTSYLPFANSI